MNIDNLLKNNNNKINLFDKLNNADNELNKIINIKFIQRNGKKNWTLVEGMESIDNNLTKKDYKKQLKYLKKIMLQWFYSNK